MIFNEACLNNYANLQSTRIKSSDQSFHDCYHVFLTPPLPPSQFAACGILSQECVWKWVLINA